MVEQAQYQEALILLRETVRQFDNGYNIAHTLNPLAIAAGRLGLYDEAEQAARESAAIFHDIGTVSESNALDTLGEIYYWQERYRDARRIHERSLQLHHDLGFSYDTSYQHKQIAFDACLLGDYHAGREHFRSALTQLQGKEVRGMHILADVLIGCALLLAAAGDLERAVELLALAERYPDAGGCDRHDRDEEHLREDLRAELPPDIFQAAWQRGTALPLEDLAAGLLAELP